MTAAVQFPLLPSNGKGRKAAEPQLTEIILSDGIDTKNETIADLVRKIIVMLGEDPNREGLRKTPERYEKAIQFLTSGYTQRMDSVLKWRNLQCPLRPNGGSKGY